MANIYDASNKYKLEVFLEQVAEAILQNNLSLFLGAGSSMQYGAMNWNDLVNQVLNDKDNLDETYWNKTYWNNTEKAQYAELKNINVKRKVAEVISNMEIDSRQKNTFLYYLLDFDYKSLWTTNYDCIIENILEKEKSKKYIPIYKYSHFKNLSYPGGYFLYKINGNGSIKDYKTIVITHEDFIDYRRTHEAYLILLKRELLCNSFLFLGCSFDDDILRMCIKDILNCIDNSTNNYSTNHFAIIVDKDNHKLDFLCDDMCKHYNINCLKVNNVKHSHIIAYGISHRVKYNSIFISGAKRFERYSKMEECGKRVCQQMVNAFMNRDENPFKFISGMGMSIGHFISGTIKKNCIGKNLNRYLQMEPFPFSDPVANSIHRKSIISKAGIFIFIYGDIEDITKIEQNGMWKEYLLAKSDKNNIIIAIPCGKDSISYYIFQKEVEDMTSFSYQYKELINLFDYKKDNNNFFECLVDKVKLASREKKDQILDEIDTYLKTFS